MVAGYFLFLDQLFAPVLALPSSVSLMIFSALMVFISTLFSRLFVNQKRMKEIKDEQKELQKTTKELQKTDPSKANEEMSKSLKLSNEIMKMQYKSLIPTLIIAMVLWPWISSNYMIPVMITSIGNDTYSGMFIDGDIQKNFTTHMDKEIPGLFGKSYEYTVSFENEENLKAGDTIIFNKKWRMSGFYKAEKEDEFDRIVMGEVIVTPPFPVPFFEYGFGWLIWYFIASLPFSVLFRKLLGVA